MFPVLQVPDQAAELPEQMGTKYKFWYQDEHLGLSLFKEGRPNTGENWAEKLACELAGALGMPHAYYELATWRDKCGTVTPSLVGEGERIVHGNEVLAVVHSGNNRVAARERHRQHTITAVMSYLRAGSGNRSIRPPLGFDPTDHISSPLDVFVGYLMFDVWIGNQDRHDQNWGVSRSAANQEVRLLPSYDHGSSLNRNEADHVLTERLTTRDIGRHISTHARKARSALFPRTEESNTKALLTSEAFEYAARLRPKAAREWIERLAAVDDERVAGTIEAMPEAWMSDAAKRFVQEYLRLNRLHILGLDWKK
ncbi:phosphatidylinositol kinase [Bordetella genomosp. 7]|uniref:phosphatidylinositol kinase n=1 Tax=Bordetella genomosp. 7 TaxID=1416805 RepID=UPI001140845C|nr:phosphatidylinositol kinase [Bordetella genomosp. 7]